jgi:hypothetical protein
VLFLRKNTQAQHYLAKLASKHGKPKALTIPAHKLARTVYSMLSRNQAFQTYRVGPEVEKAAVLGGQGNMSRTEFVVPARSVYVAPRAEKVMSPEPSG